jgi:hypothetical protein
MYDAYRCFTLPKTRMCATTSNRKKHEYREEIYAGAIVGLEKGMY